MGNIAGMDAQEAVLPDPEQVFLNAQIAALQRAREKALRPLVIAEFVVRIMIILALAAGSPLGMVWVPIIGREFAACISAHTATVVDCRSRTGYFPDYACVYETGTTDADRRVVALPGSG